MKMSRRILFLALGALALVACQNAGEHAGAQIRTGARSAYETADDAAIGAPTAKAVLIEYASVTCPHCREFYNNVYPALKKNYIDTGKLRYVFRETPTPPVEVATAGFILARCAAPDKYLPMIEAMFDNQTSVFEALRDNKPVGEIYFGIAERVGGIKRTQAEACLKDEKLLKLVSDNTQSGIDKYKITGTPGLVLNGKKLDKNEYYTAEGLSGAIDKAVAGQPF